MPASATTCFAQRSLAVMPPGLAQALGPETQALLKVHGVGHLTALTFVLTLGSKERFGRSRDVGCYLACGRGEVSPEIMILRTVHRECV